MNTKRKKIKKVVRTPIRHLTSIEFRAISFVGVLILAGIAIFQEVKDPVIWAFLGTAIGILLGQTTQSSKIR